MNDGSHIFWECLRGCLIHRKLNSNILFANQDGAQNELSPYGGRNRLLSRERLQWDERLGLSAWRGGPEMRYPHIVSICKCLYRMCSAQHTHMGNAPLIFVLFSVNIKHTLFAYMHLQWDHLIWWRQMAFNGFLKGGCKPDIKNFMTFYFTDTQKSPDITQHTMHYFFKKITLYILS